MYQMLDIKKKIVHVVSFLPFLAHIFFTFCPRLFFSFFEITKKAQHKMVLDTFFFLMFLTLQFILCKY